MKGHIRQRGKQSWTIYLYLGRDSAGKRKYDTHTVRGTRDDAEQELIRLLNSMNEGTYVEPSRLTVKQFLERWLSDYAEPSVSPKTYERYAEIVERHLVPALGQYKLTRLRPLHIQEYYSDARRTGRLDKKGGLSPQTVLHHHRVLSESLQQAVRWQMLTRNPAHAVEPPKPKRSEMKTLSTQETTALIEAASGDRVFMPIMLAVTTGMRRGEILAARWADLSWRGKTLTVRRSLEETKAAGLRYKEPKSGRGRVVALPKIAIEAMRQHRAEQSKRRLQLGPAYSSEPDLICDRGDGSPWKPRAFSKAFSALIDDVGLPKVRFHDLRHGHATHLLGEGIHPKVVSERLGHSKIGITLDTYSHVLPTMQEEAASAIDDSLGRASGEKKQR